LYCFGGMEPSAITPKASKLAFRYDPDNNTWTQAADMPAGKGAGSATFYDGKIYLTGGYPMEDETYAYDVATDTWETLPAPSARHAPLLAAAGERLWLTAGGDVWDALVVPDQYFDFTAWGAVGTSFSPGRVSPAGGYIKGYGIFLAGGEWEGDPAGSETNYLWHICVPTIKTVEPPDPQSGDEITITAGVYEENVAGFLFDAEQQPYPFSTFEVIDDSTIHAVLPNDLAGGSYGIALVGSLGQVGRLAEAFTIPDGDDDSADDDSAGSDDDAGDDDASDDDDETKNDSGDNDDGCGC